MYTYQFHATRQTWVVLLEGERVTDAASICVKPGRQNVL